MPVLAVIPARLGSTRLPEKPLQLLAGEPLVVRVADRVRAMGEGLVDRLVVAVDSPRVERAVVEAGYRAVRTSAAHRSGTDRVAEVAALAEFQGFDVIVNVQGDEPFLPPEALEGALGWARREDVIGTAAAPLGREAAGDPARVKVVTDLRSRALYFSRAPVPFEPAPSRRAGNGGGRGGGGSVWQHLGLYAFPRAALEAWARLAPSPLETAEGLEQLRALEHGWPIGVARLAAPAPPGIDTLEDLRQANALWREIHEEVR